MINTYRVTSNDIAYINYFLGSTEYHTTYQKPNGEVYTKITKYKPYSKESEPLSQGFTNDYGHKVLEVCEVNPLRLDY